MLSRACRERRCGCYDTVHFQIYYNYIYVQTFSSVSFLFASTSSRFGSSALTWSSITSSTLYSARWLKSTGRHALLPNISSNGMNFVDSCKHVHIKRTISCLLYKLHKNLSESCEYNIYDCYCNSTTCIYLPVLLYCMHTQSQVCAHPRNPYFLI